MKNLIIPSATELVNVAPECIVYAAADGNYTQLMLVDRSELVFSFNLQRMQQLLESQCPGNSNPFVRVGRSLIVNRNYIFRLSVPKPQIVLATPMLQHKFILPVSKEALKQLKRDMEEHLLVA